MFFTWNYGMLAGFSKRCMQMRDKTDSLYIFFVFFPTFCALRDHLRLFFLNMFIFWHSINFNQFKIMSPLCCEMQSNNHLREMAFGRDLCLLCLLHFMGYALFSARFMTDWLIWLEIRLSHIFPHSKQVMNIWLHFSRSNFQTFISATIQSNSSRTSFKDDTRRQSSFDATKVLPRTGDVIVIFLQ